jgi:glutathione S-transferase
MLRNSDSYRALLDRTDATMDKMEEQLFCANEDNDGTGWLLGKNFSAVDICLGVVLNRLALLGYQE